MKEKRKKDNQHTASDKTHKRMQIGIVGILTGIVLVAVAVVIVVKPVREPAPIEEQSTDTASDVTPAGIMTVYGELPAEELLQNLQSTVVKIEAEVTDVSGGTLMISGSGVIISITDDYVDIVTAHHVVELTATPQVTFYDSSCVSGNVLAYGKLNDVAFVRVDSSLLSPECRENLQEAVCGDNDAYRMLALQEDVYLIGSSSAVAGDVITGQIKEKDQFIPLFQNEMLLCNARVNDGMSGGGVFMADGKLMGIIVGTDDVDTVSVAITDVLAEYRSIEL